MAFEQLKQFAKKVASVRCPKTNAITSPLSWSIKYQVQRGRLLRPTNDQNSSLSARFILNSQPFATLALEDSRVNLVAVSTFFNRPKHGGFAHFQHPNCVGHFAAVIGHLQNPLFDLWFRHLVGVVQLKGFSAGLATAALRVRLAFAHFYNLFGLPALPTLDYINRSLT